MASTGVAGRISATDATVGATAAQLTAGRSTRKSLTIQNVDTVATDHIFIGADANVTTANGYRIAPGESHKFDEFNGPVFAIATTAATPVRLLEAY